MNDKRNRIDVIDAFRGVAIMSVLLFHYLVRWAPPFSPVDIYGYRGRYSSHLELGALGVEVFFVISGLVIAMTLAECESALEFLVKRFARLYPAYVGAASLTFALMSLFGPMIFKVRVADYLVNLTMLSGDLGHPWVDGAYWSLAVEIKFYFLATVGFVLFRANFWKFLIGVGVVGAIIERIKPGYAEMILIAQYMPLFIIGIAAWLALLEGKIREGAVTAMFALFLYGLNERFMFFTKETPHWLGDAFILGVTVLMVVLLWLTPTARFGPLAFIGRISYSLYLLHQFIGTTIIVMLKRLGTPDLLAITGAVTVCGLLACASFVFVEQQGRRAIMSVYFGAFPRTAKP